MKIIEEIAAGRTDRVHDLIASGQPANASDENGVPVIRWCAYHGDVSALRALLDAGESLATLGSDSGLRSAAFHGHPQLCRFLIDENADVNAADPDTRETPLHLALCKANRPIYDHVVAVLLKNGADPDAATRPGVETGAFMRDCRTRGETPLHRAAAYGTTRAIDLLIDAGADLTARDVNGDSPLSWASWHLRPPAVLRRLCFGEFSIHPDNASTYDHGAGWHTLDTPLRIRDDED